MENNANYSVQMKNITKSFGGTKVLDDVDFETQAGKIYSILGENGAGKTTLMNILYGFYSMDSGEIYINGEKRKIKSPKDALNLGIGMVHQHFMLIDKFTVENNIILGREPTKALGVIDRKNSREKMRQIIDEYNLDLNLKTRVRDLNVAKQQKIEILKLLYNEADILILDEPTAILSEPEADMLIEILKGLASKGKTIILITHKMAEIKKCADVCVVIKNGKISGKVNVDEVSEDDLAKLMSDEEPGFNLEKEKPFIGRTVCNINDLFVQDNSKAMRVKGLSLQVKKGEVVGIIGAAGNGQSELLDVLSGLRKCQKGEIYVNRVAVQNKKPKFIRDQKVAIVHEDRIKRGLIFSMTVSDNVIIEKYKNKEMRKGRVLNSDKVNEYTETVVNKYKVKPQNCSSMMAGNLSGGNQQKLIFGRELENNPDFIVISQPTKGVDLENVKRIHQYILRERAKGKAILLMSYDLDELMTLCDRIEILYDGRISASVPAENFDKNNLKILMAGGRV